MRKQIATWILSLLILAGSLTACTQPQSEAGEAEGSPASAAPEASEQKSVAEKTDLPQEPEPEPLTPELDNLMQTIDTLCVEPRPLGSMAEYHAAKHLQDRLEAYGYLGELEEFSYNISRETLFQRFRQVQELSGDAFFEPAIPGDVIDGDSQNVIGRQPWEWEKDQVLLLSAHYDSTPDSIGVIDNASGVAVVLEAARILAGEDLPFALRVVFFGGEEEILIGSRQHVLAMGPEETARILGNINVDTVAYLGQEEFVALTPLALDREDASNLTKNSPVAAALLADSRVAPSFGSNLVSDYLAFTAAGIDSVNFGQSMDAVASLINSPADTYELLTPELLPVATEILVDAVRELARQVEGQE